MTEIPSQTFNSDLLLSDIDRKRAGISFPKISHILDFPELRDLFLRYDVLANRAKKRLHLTGLLSVILGVTALLGISAEPLYGHLAAEIWLARLAALFAIAGVLSVTIGTFGVFNSRFKQRWLQCRLMTERIRQFQFQTLVCRIPPWLAKPATSESAAELIQAREQWLAQFLLDYESQLPGKLQDVLADDEEENIWIIDTQEDGIDDISGESFDQYTSAYRILRINHQIGYANYKLRSDTLSFPLMQNKILREVSLICILIVFLVHFFISLMYSVSSSAAIKEWLDSLNGTWVHVLVIWTAVIALTARTLEEGLQPTREVERYRHYKAALGRLLYHFDHAADSAAKIRVMKEVERTVYEEMRGFLKTHDEAKFVL